jgi:hypothetical protein
MGHDDLVTRLENAAKKHRKTVLIAAHLMNLEYDLARWGNIFDRCPNLYVDISARLSGNRSDPRAPAGARLASSAMLFGALDGRLRGRETRT